MKKLIMVLSIVCLVAWVVTSVRENTPEAQQRRIEREQWEKDVARERKEYEEKNRDPNEGVRGAGWLVAKGWIPKYLNDPNSAEFPWDTVRYSIVSDETEWKVTGSVRAKNAFGGVITKQWSVSIVAEGPGKFKPTALYLDGKKLL